MKKFFKLALFSILSIFATFTSVHALTTWKFADWQDGTDYGTKTKVSENITNLKGETTEKDGMKTGPYSKASKAKLSEGITEEVYVGLDLDNYQNSELFELSIALNQEDGGTSKYLTEAVVMTQKSGDKFVITANNWNKDKNTIATIDKKGVYTYKWEFKKEDNKIKVRFTVLDYGEELGSTDFVELNVANPEKATDVRYLWACNIKAAYGVDIYTTLPEKSSVTNPETSDINVVWLILAIAIGVVGLSFLKMKKNN